MDLASMTIGDFVNAGAWVSMVILLVRGDVVAKPVMEKMMKHGRDQTKLLAKSVEDGIKEAVKQGILEANYELNGKKKKK